MSEVDPGFRGLKIELTGSQTTAMPAIRKALMDALVENATFEPQKISTHERRRMKMMSVYAAEGETDVYSLLATVDVSEFDETQPPPTNPTVRRPS